MNINELLLSIATNSVIMTSLLAIFGFFGRSLIEQWLTKNLEKYKMNLQATNDMELEKMKQDIGKLRFDYESRMSKVIAKRLEIMETLHKHLAKYGQGLNKMQSRLMDLQAKGTNIKGMTFTEVMTSGFKSEFEKDAPLPELWSIAWDYFIENRLYLSKDLSERIEKQLLLGISALLPAISATNYEARSHLFPSDFLKNIELLKNCNSIEIVSELISEFHQVMEELEAEFRSQFCEDELPRK